MSPDIEVTPASVWKQGRKGILVELPSGRVVKTRTTFSIMAAMQDGTIPNTLATLFVEQMQKGEGVTRAQMSKENLTEMDHLMQVGICGSIIEPTFVLVPEDEDPKSWEPENENEVSIADLSDTDRNFLWGVIQGGSPKLARFPGESSEHLGTVADEQAMEKSPIKSNRPAPRDRLPKQRK